ncbi:MAG TPA: chromosome segregation protein SMC [Opitutaceae bacterium]|nr:chromosome segregation protein SMC [Opitutaceae bacterium]
MHLKALGLHGFKSFADPTTLSFEPGVTAVVGPNGCGKSNIADAIRWVLGEQSPKALRGGKMQDVIFEGADTRRPSQLCEVSMLLTECEKQLGSDFHEIEITRRVHRDGESEYLFNGQACRLKDIHKLFMDTGVGRTSYSIMAQNQIDQILSSKPEERRSVFEEAAGITKYKSQRKEAMAKLALTDQNLARVTDVVAEIARQIGSLKRQASKAMRYRRLGHRLRHLSLASSAFQHGRLAESLGVLDGTLAALRTEAERRRTALDAQQSGLEARKADRSRLNQRVQDAQQAVYDLRSQKEHAENEANLARIKRSGLADRLAGTRDSLGELEMQLREVSAQVDTGSQDKQMQLGLLGSSDAVYQQHNRELAVAEGELSKLERDLQQAKFEVLQFDSAVARIRTESSGFEVDQKTSLHRHEALAGDLKQAADHAGAAAKAAAEAAARAEEMLGARSRANEAAAAAQQAVGDVTREFREVQRALQDTDRQIAQRGARLRLLQQLQERWEGFGEGAKAVLQGRLAGALAGSKATPVTQGIEVKAEFGRAVEALLGSAAEAIQVSDLATARRVLAQLEQEQIGSIILRISEFGAAGGGPAELPAGVAPATAALAQIADNHPARAILASCYIADDLGTFLDFWRVHPEFPFLAVATRKGEVADRRGLVSGGHANPKAHANSIVQRDIDLRETARALAEDQRRHDELHAQSDALNARIADAEQALEERRAAVLNSTQAVAAAQAEERNARRGAEESSARAQRMERELASVEHARLEAQARWERAKADLALSEAAAAAHRRRIEELEARLAAARAERDVKRESLSQARLELAERRQKVEVIDRGLGEMERRRGQIGDLLLQRQQEIEAWTDQIAELEAQEALERSNAGRIGETLSVSQEQVEKIRAGLVEVERQIGSLEESQAALRQESDAAHEQLSAHEVRLAEGRQRAVFLAEEVAREFQADVAAIEWREMLWRVDDEPAGLKPLDLDEDEDAEPVVRRPRKRRPENPQEADLVALESTNWEAVKAEVDALRQRMGSMGAVNLVAIEEYSELKQRHDFLKAQSDDLTRAKTELVAAIDEINQTSQRQFQVTFEQVCKNFEFTFQTLFGGGRASIELVQAEDILESGIEIVVQPPGTRLKNISLLSGGQRTLTAVALLFALYLVKPSPFCLLDELDAPLDESNIGRFTDLLRKFVTDSQFIIITHNKRTVAAANAIYGVTMEERGVSKTVSMRFNHERGEAEAHHAATVADSVRNAAPVLPEPMSPAPVGTGA